QGGSTGGGAGGGTALRACSALGTAAAGDVISNPTVSRVSSNSSRFGMRGTESLGGGLNAIFQVESNVSWDSGNSSSSGIASRETFAGLQGSWGKVTMGKFLAPQDDLHPIFGNAPTLTTSILATSDVWAFGNLAKGAGGFDARLGNNVRYDSPNYQGFTGAFQVSTRDDSGNTTQTPFGGDNGDHTSVMRHAYVYGGNIIYSNGPIQAGVAFERNQKVRSYTADAFATAGVPGTSAANPFNANDTDWTITGAYDFGTIMQGFGLRLAAVYEKTKYDTPTGDLKRDFWGISGTIPAGGGKVYLFYGKAGNGKGGAVDGENVGYLVKGADTGVKQYEASYSYNLSPRTMLNVGYVKLSNDCKAAYTFNINAYNIAVGQLNAAPGSPGDFCSGKPGGLVLGFVHLF
ncbi:MAG TPA: porin, partial [Casimicrobiaceae bacterium]|nr:porin [Casimicrobiaceae bacterium]